MFIELSAISRQLSAFTFQTVGQVSIPDRVLAAATTHLGILLECMSLLMPRSEATGFSERVWVNTNRVHPRRLRLRPEAKLPDSRVTRAPTPG